MAKPLPPPRPRLATTGDEALIADSVVVTRLDRAIGWARKYSIFPYPFATACCAMEYMSLSMSPYDIDRFGALLPRFTPRQADLLMVIGTVPTRKALTTCSPEQLVDMVKASNLRGRGGAGFPTGLKWSFLPKQTAKPVYLAVNADESEPGTFKDRVIIEQDPHQLLEGIIISAYAIRCHTAYVYIRGEFALGAERLEAAIAEARGGGLLGRNILGTGFDLDVWVHRGAGAYICGEETGLIESLEGKRGYPRIKPPFPATHGLFGCPTIVNNVETLACVPHIVLRGADWFRAIGPEKSPGPKLFCVSGHVVRPRTYELPMGTPP